MARQSYRELNAELNLFDENGQIQFHKDKEAARDYFINEEDGINSNTVFYHTLKEKTDRLIEDGYWKKETVLKYGHDGLKELFQHAHSFKHRFSSFIGAYKFYTSYALKTNNGKRFLERFEDRVVLTAIEHSTDFEHAKRLVGHIIEGRFQPATPTFLNAGRVAAGGPTSCYLLRVEDNMESIGRAVIDALQLSKRGGGVALNLSNIRESGAPIKNIENQSSGIIPVMKMLEDAFSYANQLGARQGAGAVYLNAHHPDILSFLDTKRENADEKVRIKTLSVGVVVPDITFELLKSNEDMLLFSPYDIKKYYGLSMADFSMTEWYRTFAEDERINRKAINARKLFKAIAEVNFESGYPYIMFEDTVNHYNPAKNVGRISQSNLCVAPETRVLTDKGYFEISELAGQTVNAWNGEKFSPSLVAKTGENQQLITVMFSNGGSLDVTPYHKFYVKNDPDKPAVEVRAAELIEGDRLEEFELGVVDAPAEDLFLAYLEGERIAKLILGERRAKPTDLPLKSLVPTGYSLKSRLEWLAGLIDEIGYGTGATGIQMLSFDADFLEEVRVLLATLGVHSKWFEIKDGGRTQFQLRKRSYQLAISGSEAQKLRKLGLPTKRVIIDEYEYQRTEREPVKVTGVFVGSRIDDTYCLNEPERHKVVFEGIQTGNCSEILQPQQPSTFHNNGHFDEVGRDIACNLGSLNVAKMEKADEETFAQTVEDAVQFLSNVAVRGDFSCSPSVEAGNAKARAIGLGQMNLHGHLIEQGVAYDSPEAVSMWRDYIQRVTYHAIKASCDLAEAHTPFDGFDGSGWQSGETIGLMIQDMIDHNADPELVDEFGQLQERVSRVGVFNQHLQAIPPTGSISYINGSTSSIHPITSKIEIRKEGKLGRTYYPAYGLTNDNFSEVKTAYQLGPNPIIDMYAASTPYVDQGQSLTLFFTDEATTRDINRAQNYAHKAGVKTIYYIRIQQKALAGTEVDGCVSCML